MPTTLRPDSILDAAQHSNYIAEFKHKTNTKNGLIRHGVVLKLNASKSYWLIVKFLPR